MRRLKPLFPVLLQAAPGIVIVVALWLVTFTQWRPRDYVDLEMEALWQSAGRENLTMHPLGTLSVLHIQPPGMNALFALDLAVTPTSHALLLSVNLLAMIVTIILVVDTIRRFGAPRWLGMGAGIAYAILPSTVIYSQWAYSVTLISLFSVTAVWGIALIRTRPNLGGVLSTAAVALATSTRPSFTAVFFAMWLVLVVVLLVRRGARRTWLSLVFLVPIAAAVLGLQLYYVVSFGLPTMSSWSGENVAKSLKVSQSLSVTDEARAEIAGNPCRAQMLEAYERDQLNRWDWRAFRGLPACSLIPELAPRGVAAWDAPTKGESGEENFVFAERLVASREWTGLMTTILRHDPWQLVRMALTTDYGPRNSGVGLYLSPAEDYPFVKDIRDAQPLAVPLGIWSLLFPAAAWTLILVGIVLGVSGKGPALRTSAIFWSGVVLAAYHMAVNVLFEYSENMRYRAEIDSVLMVLSAIILSVMVRSDTKRAVE